MHRQHPSQPSPSSPAPLLGQLQQSICSECGQAAGRKCALCSACGGAFHPQCLEPPLQHRPPGSKPGALLGKNTWVCFHCECAIPVVVPAGEDDPDAMAALEWSAGSGFGEPAFEGKLRAFWRAEHARTVRVHEESMRRRRERLQEEKKIAEKDVRLRGSYTCFAMKYSSLGRAYSHVFACFGLLNH